MNTPTLSTERLILRRFTPQDVPALFEIHRDPEVNRYLPWFPLASLEEAEAFFEERYARADALPGTYRYAICLKGGGGPIGYVHVDGGEARDLGYGLLPAFWRRGIVTEAARAVVAQAKRDGVPYLTATHDINNPRSGHVMQALGMRYQYSYEELWQPKNFPVIFRLYQRNLDGREERVYRGYWDRYPRHFTEEL